MQLEFSKQFLKDVAGLSSGHIQRTKEKLEIFQQDPKNIVLRNHRLKGKLKNFWSINVTGDLRALYTVEKSKEGDIAVKFTRLGTHSQLY